MSEVTFVLTRNPKREFFYTSYKGNEDRSDLSEDEIQGLYRTKDRTIKDAPNILHYSGRWGTLGMFRGGKVYSAKLPDTAKTDKYEATQVCRFAGKELKLLTDGTPVKLVKEYTTMERFRWDYFTRGNYYVQLHPEPNAPYLLRLQNGFTELTKMRRSNLAAEYVRIEGTPKQREKMSAPEQAILFHEAANVTWVTGCISPRTKDDERAFDKDDAGNPSVLAMTEILDALRAQPRGEGWLFVLDW
jgi:hypothetical protein